VDETIEKSIINYLEDNRFIVFIVFFAFILLLTPQLIKINNGDLSLIGEESYFNLNIANQLSEQNNFLFLLNDHSSYNGRTVLVNPYQILLSFFNNELFSRIIPIVFGLISLLLIYLISNKMNLSEKIKNLTLLMITLSPIFLFVFSTSTKYSMIITFFLLGFYFFLGNKYYHLFLSCIFFSVVSLFGFFEIFLILISLFVYISITKNKKIWFLYICIILLLIMFIFNFFILNNLQPNLVLEFSKNTFLRDIISDFGSATGLGIFKFILAIIGFVVIWNKKNDNLYLLILLILISLSVFLYEKANIIYASFFLAFFSALGLNYFIEKKWEVNLLKYLTILTIFSGLLFSSVSYLNIVSETNYSFDEEQGLIWLKESKQPGLILSHYSNGFFINYKTGMPVLMDSYFKHNVDINNYYRVSNSIFQSYNLLNTAEMLNSLEIKYIIVNKRMKEGLVWENNDGLLFLFRNTEVFEKIYENDDISIYEFIKIPDQVVY
jgi:hypothetical protein